MKNRALHSEIGHSPYAAMFSNDLRVGLASLSDEIAEQMETEEELLEILENLTSQNETQPASAFK